MAMVIADRSWIKRPVAEGLGRALALSLANSSGLIVPASSSALASTIGPLVTFPPLPGYRHRYRTWPAAWRPLLPLRHASTTGQNIRARGQDRQKDEAHQPEDFDAATQIGIPE